MQNRFIRGIKLNIEIVVILIYALFATHGIMLAFASSHYSFVLSILIPVVSYVSLPLGLFLLWKKSWIDRKNVYLLLLPLLYWFLLLIHTDGGYSGDWAVALIAICCFCMFCNSMKRYIFEFFYWIILLNNLISIFYWICYSLNINIGFKEVSIYSELAGTYMGRNYVKWGIFAIYKDAVELRLCGIFNEPGALGTICALFLIATFRYSKLWQKLLLIITGFLTFSFAFYLMLFAFSACYLVRKNVKNVVLLIFFLIIFLVLPQIDWGNDSVNIVMERFKVTESGLVGDNRTANGFDNKYAQMKNSDKIWFGYGAGNILAAGGLSYKQYVVQFGYIGYGLLLLLWLIAGVVRARGNKDAYLLLFFFLLSLYQRPGAMVHIYGYILLFGGVEYLLYHESELKVAKNLLEAKQVKNSIDEKMYSV